MAIAHIATEYVFSDFLLKEPPETRYKGLRLELALDKIVTCIAVGLPLLLISLAFAQEVSMGNRSPPPPPPRGTQRLGRGGGSAARAGDWGGLSRAPGGVRSGSEQSVPGGVREPWRCGAEGRGQCAGVGHGELSGIFQP